MQTRGQLATDLEGNMLKKNRPVNIYFKSEEMQSSQIN